jgi:hypothetical protein
LPTPISQVYYSYQDDIVVDSRVWDVLHGKTVVTSALILFLTVMLVLVGPLAPVSRTYAQLVETMTANASPNPAILGSLVTVSGSGFQPNCGPPGSGAPCIFEIIFVPGGGCGFAFADQLGVGGGGVGVLGFAPLTDGTFGNSFFATTNQYGAFSASIFLGDAFSAINYSIIGFDETHEFCIDPFTIVLQLCVIQFGVEQPDGVTSWLPGYGYPNLPPSSCPDMTEQYGDGSGVYGAMIVVHQFVQNRTFYIAPVTTIFTDT